MLTRQPWRRPASVVICPASLPSQIAVDSGSPAGGVAQAASPKLSIEDSLAATAAGTTPAATVASAAALALPYSAQAVAM